MKTFWKDYGEVCGHSIAFFKKHWKGCILLYVISFACTMAVYYKDEISNYLKTKFGKKEKEES